MSHAEIVRDIARYAPLGLIANPFAAVKDDEQEVGIGLEIYAAANRLLGVLAANAGPEASRPIVVSKSTEVPNFYHLRAISMAEGSLVNDDSLNLQHGYIQLFMMRRGRIRSTLSAFGERLVFRGFDKTMSLYIEQMLEEPDEDLAAYQILGPEGLAAFKEQFSADPLATFVEHFGDDEIERRPELGEVADLRLVNLDVDAEELESSPEIDMTIGDAPGTGMVLAEEREVDTDKQAVVDYVVEYVSKHLSPVVARGLRIYRERGLAAATTEMSVTKAPKKTLNALVDLARVRFSKTAIIYDGFEGWGQVPPEMRQSIVGTMSELRWMLDGKTVLVFLLEEGVVPELEEAFSGGTPISWDFSNLIPLQEAPNAVNTDMLNEWMGSAAQLGAKGLSMDNPVLTSLAERAAGDLGTFANLAFEAIESAADRGLTELDDQAATDAVAALDEPVEAAE